MTDTGVTTDRDLEALAQKMATRPKETGAAFPIRFTSETGDLIKAAQLGTMMDVRAKTTGDTKPVMVLSQFDLERALQKTYPGTAQAFYARLEKYVLSDGKQERSMSGAASRVFDAMVDPLATNKTVKATVSTLKPYEKAQMIMGAMQGSSYAVKDFSIVMLDCRHLVKGEDVFNSHLSTEHEASAKKLGTTYTAVHEFYHHRPDAYFSRDDKAMQGESQREEVLTEAKTLKYLAEKYDQDGLRIGENRLHNEALGGIFPEYFIDVKKPDEPHFNFISHPMSIFMDAKDGQIVPAPHLNLQSLDQMGTIDQKVFKDAIRSHAFANMAVVTANAAVSVYQKMVVSDDKSLTNATSVEKNYAAAKALQDGNVIQDPVACLVLKEHTDAVEASFPDVAAKAPVGVYRAAAAYFQSDELKAQLTEAMGPEALERFKPSELTLFPQEAQRKALEAIDAQISEDGTDNKQMALGAKYQMCPKP